MHVRSGLYAFGLLSVALSAGTAAAQPAAADAALPAPDPALMARVGELPALLRGQGDYDRTFASGFRAQVPRPQFDTLARQLADAYGAVRGVTLVRAVPPWSAELRVDFAKGSARAEIVLDPAPPHPIAALRIAGASSNEASIAAVRQEFAALPGVAGFAFARLGDGAPERIEAHQPDRPLAVGSAFKLVILAKLVRATNAGERRWDDLVTLDGSVLPAGGYNLKPKGTQVSLRELATQMISVSDNSATDILLATLGRDRVEAMLPVIGVEDPARNRPFLSTMELFKLKGIEGNDLADRYLAQDEAGRRRMLDGEVAGLPALLIRPSLFRDGKPARIERIEWFFTPADLVRTMDWLRRNTEGPAGAEARAVLSKNPGIPRDVAARWPWVGYKGGSEPGVMNMTLLLRAAPADWYVLTASWNDPAQPVNEARLVGLIARAAELAAPAR